jgi:hypothetical protein
MALARAWVAQAASASEKAAARERALDLLRPFCSAINRDACALVRDLHGTVPPPLRD